jgi:hypothetical protein
VKDRIDLIFLIAVYILLAIGITRMAAGVSVIPNNSEVRGLIKEKSIDNAGVSRLTLYVISANDYNGMPNFMKENIGKNITVLVQSNKLHCFKSNEVNMLIKLSGDERGQFYVGVPKECV